MQVSYWGSVLVCKKGDDRGSWQAPGKQGYFAPGADQSCKQTVWLLHGCDGPVP